MDTDRRRYPKPKLLLAVLMGVAFLGSSCAVQKIFTPIHEVPSEQEVAKLLAQAGQPLLENAAGQHFVSTVHELLAEQVRVARRYQLYSTGVELVLAGVYSFVFVFGLRAFGAAQGAARPLARAALLVLPVRVAVAAVDLAAARALQPAARSVALAMVDMERPLLPPEAQAAAAIRALGEAAPWVAIGAQIGLTVLVCALFQYASHYFQRPDVVEYFDRGAAPRAGI